MADPVRVVLSHLRKLMGHGPSTRQNERALLERFVHQHDESAFAELVQRHGPMVLGVCRRILQNAADADDAFQVTFLTLACKARSLRDGQALASWLYRVAAHTALRARANAARRRRLERQALVPPDPDPAAAAAWRELGPVLDEELSRLPEKCRAPLVLCCLEGKTNEEAARALGWPTGSISKRLARGRELLRRRLARRGFVPSAGALAALLSEAASAAVPGPLAQATVRAALLTGTGRTAAGGLSASVAGLLRQNLQAMLLKRLKFSVMVFLALGVLGMAAALGLRETPPRPEAPPELPHARGDRFGDALPPDAVARIGTVRLRHGGGVAALVLTSDGKKVVSVGWQGMPPLAANADPDARVWDGATGKEIRRFPLRGLAGTPLGEWALSPDGKVLAMAEGNKVVMRGANIGGGPLGFQFAGGGAMVPLFGPEQGGNAPATKTPPTIHLWDVQTGKEIRRLPQPANPTELPRRLAFSADGKVLASWGGDSAIRVWDVATGKEHGRLALAPNQGVSCLAWSPDGRRLAVGQEGTIRLWHMPAGRPGPLLRGHREGPVALAFSPDGKVLASGGANQVRLWDVAGGTERRALPEQVDPAEAVAFSPDGRTVTAVSRDGEGGVWDAATGKEIRRFALMEYPADRDTQYMLNLGFRSCTYQPLALAADGGTVARLSVPNSIVLWNVAAGRYLHPWGDSALASNLLQDSASNGTFAFSADGKRLASLCADGKIRLWRVRTGEELRRFEGHEELLAHLAFSADGKTLVSLAAMPPMGRQTALAGRGTFRSWDLATGRELRHFPIPEAGAYAVSPDGKMVAAAGLAPNTGLPPFLVDATVVVRDLVTGTEVRRFQAPAERPVTSVAFSPDGRTLAAASAGTPVCLWDMVTGKEMRRFGEPAWQGKDQVNPCRVTFADGGKTLVAVRCPTEFSPTRVRVQVCAWDLATGKQTRPPSDLPAGWDFRAFSPDGKALAFTDPSHAVRVWDLEGGRERCRFTGHRGPVLGIVFSPDGKLLASGSQDTTILIWDLTAQDSGHS
jgi:RNA polymerase sigma factor (sigma-70 family)